MPAFEYETTFTSRRYPIDLHITEVDFQRNGVGGEGFYVVKFTQESKADGAVALNTAFIGVVFDAPSHVAVINPDNLASHWRGDVYEDALREVIAAWSATR